MLQSTNKTCVRLKAYVAIALCLVVLATGCSPTGQQRLDSANTQMDGSAQDTDAQPPVADSEVADSVTGTDTAEDTQPDESATATLDSQAPPSRNYTIVEDYRSEFVHGSKPAEYQRYIMLHDTEGQGSPQSVINYWDNTDALVAAHFIVGVDGAIYQCVPMDSIAHHAGYGDPGSNAAFGVADESRDDKRGTTFIGSSYTDYGMNSYSVGIEMVHVGGAGDYPAAQLEALDYLIAYIDGYYGFESTIIDHNDWRSSNSDTSAEFAGYLANYQAYRSHRAP